MEQFWLEALKQVPALAVVCVFMLCMVAWVLKTMKSLQGQLGTVVGQFLGYMDDRDSRLSKTENRVINAFERNSEALGWVDSMKDEIRELRHENTACHRELIHSFRDLANAAGLEHILDQRQQVHHAKGGPPGSIVVETPPMMPVEDAAETEESGS